MITIDTLREFGADTASGLGRCMNNEALCLKLVNKAVDDKNFDRLKDAVEADERQAAFQAVHALKGVMGNLSLTPIYDPAYEMTELLRANQEADYPAYLERILKKRAELAALRES